MKRIFAYFCIALIFTAQGTGALEIEIKGGVDGMGFKPDQVSQAEKFEPFPGILGNFALRTDISKECSFSFNLARDNLFHNFGDIRFTTRLDYFGFEAGIFTGATDYADTFHAGFLGHIEVIWPGVLFFQFGGSSTIGSDLDFMSGVSRQSAEAKLGFMIPYVITTISAEMKNFTWHPTRDNLYRIQLSADISFGKTLPLALCLNGGYQILSRTYEDDTKDEISAGFVGLNLQFDAGKHLRFSLGGEMPFLPVTKEPLEAPEQPFKMFKAYAGMTIKIFKSERRSKTTEEYEDADEDTDTDADINTNIYINTKTKTKMNEEIPQEEILPQTDTDEDFFYHEPHEPTQTEDNNFSS